MLLSSKQPNFTPFRSFVLWAWLGLIPIIAVGYTNCSSYSENNMFEGSSSMCPEGNCTLVNGELMSIKTTTPDLLMACNQDHLTVSGTCNPGDSLRNYITYSLNSNGTPIFWGYGAQAINTASDATCENGRFQALVRRPSNPPNCTNCRLDLDLVLQLHYIPKEGGAAKLATQYSERIAIAFGGCTEPASPPAAPPTDLAKPPVAVSRVGACWGAASTAAGITCQSNLAGVPAPSVRWTISSSGAAQNMEMTCPSNRKRYGSCFEKNICASPATTCSSTNPIVVECDFACI